MPKLTTLCRTRCEAYGCVREPLIQGFRVGMIVDLVSVGNVAAIRAVGGCEADDAKAIGREIDGISSFAYEKIYCACREGVIHPHNAHALEDHRC